MNNYKLIKLTEGYIIVSSENIELNDYYLNNYHILICHEIKTRSSCKKIIASNFIPELPSIDFNGMEEEFGIVDVEKFKNDSFDNMGYHSTVTPYEENQFKLGYKLGFNKSQELNKDKLYTEEDLRVIFGLGAANNTNGKPSFEEAIQSLQPKTEQCVEIETKENSIKIIKQYGK